MGGAQRSLSGTLGSGGGVRYFSERTRVTRLGRAGEAGDPGDGPVAGASGLIRKEFVGADGPVRLSREVRALRRLGEVPGVPRLVRVDEDGQALVMEDLGGRPLGELGAQFRDGTAGLGALVRLAADLARIMGAIHRAGVIHRDLSPANVLVAGDRPLVIDFDLAVLLEDPDTDPGEVVGTLPYLAPEQTGRTAGPVDSRADLYALGAVVYELAVGHPPFGAGTDDPLALVHAHLAVAPRPPAEVAPQVPPTLSAIILRLLEKEPDRRYAGADGLAHDLARLAEELAGGGGDEPFVLGERDFPLRLAAPAELLGRSTERAVLQRLYDEVQAGAARGLLVRGRTGVGKTALLDHLRALAVDGGGWSVRGSFGRDPRRPDADGVRQALAGLGRLLLAEPERELAVHRERLLAALGPNAGLVAGVPDLAAVLGVPAEPPDGDPDTVQDRLCRAFAGVLAAVASSRGPVVLVLDDLQWAQAPALRQIGTFLGDDPVPGVLVVAAHRDPEPGQPGLTGTGHRAALARWEALPGVVTLELADLGEDDLGLLLAGTLRQEPRDLAPLTAAVHARTGGNPFDSIELINALRQEGALTVAGDGWAWRLEAVGRVIGDGDVQGFLAARVRRLPPATREVLQVLALLGGEATPRLLAAAAGLSTGQVRRALLPAAGDGLVSAPAGDELPEVADPPEEDPQAGVPGERRGVLFADTRVPQAVAGTLSAARARRLSLDVARRLAAHEEYAARAAAQYLTAVEGLRGWGEPGGAAGPDDPGDPPTATGPSGHGSLPEILPEAAEREAVGQLFLGHADGIRLVDPGTADRFLAQAERLLVDDDPGDGTVRPSVLRLWILRHEVFYALGRTEETDQFFERIRYRCTDPVPVAEAGAIQVSGLFDRFRVDAANELGRELLAALGFPVPTEPTVAIHEGLGRLIDWAERQDARSQDPADLPEATDPRVIAAGQVIRRLSAPSFVADPMLFAWLGVTAHQLVVQHGKNSVLLAAAGSSLTLPLVFRDDYPATDLVAHRILVVAEAAGYRAAASFVRMIRMLAGAHWRRPLENSVAESRVARDGRLAVGDAQSACLAYTPLLAALLETAPNLEQTAQEADRSLALAGRTGNDPIAAHLLAVRQLVRALRGTTAALGSFAADDFDETAHLASVAGIPPGLGLYHVYRALSAAIFDDGEALAENAAAALAVVPGLPGWYAVALAHLLQGLAHARRAQDPDVGAAARAAALEELDARRAWMAARAADAPENFAHLVHWLDAERAWAAGDPWTAVTGFEAAIRPLTARSRPWHRALITERAGLFHLRHELDSVGTHLLADARQGYADWGASGKVAELDRRFPLLREQAHRSRTGLSASAGHSAVLSTSSLDHVAALRAAQALATETGPERLRGRVVDILTTMTGASRVTLGLWNDDTGEWTVPGPDGAPVSVERAAEQGLLPLAAFRYAERTGEPLRVADATADERFARDPYLVGQRCSALLVVPIRSHGRVRAMLVLENRLIPGAFSADGLDAVMLIAGQLAMGLDNAMAERFRSLVQRAGDLTLVCDPDGRITYASAASTVLLGVEESALTGRPLQHLVATDEEVAVTGHLQECVQGTTGPGDRPLECRLRAAPPASRWVELSLTDMRADPAVGGVMVRLRDITERRQLESELRHAQKLESIGQLSAGIAHEINTPVQFIGDNLRFLTDAFAELATAVRQVPAAGVGDVLEEIPQALTDSLEGAAQVAAIVRAMKAFGAPGGESRTEADLNEIVRNTVVVAGSELRDVADVVLDLSVGLPLVPCTVGDINQVMLNLVINAAHAMAEVLPAQGRGTLTVRTLADGDHVAVEVEDTGTGIAPEIADRVFDQFFTTKPVGNGTGQGLSLAYVLVHQHHGGTLAFTTTPGEGATFTVRLPLAPRPSAPQG